MIVYKDIVGDFIGDWNLKYLPALVTDYLDENFPKIVLNF